MHPREAAINLNVSAISALMQKIHLPASPFSTASYPFEIHGQKWRREKFKVHHLSLERTFARALALPYLIFIENCV
jgi:hypothetical protein